MTMACINRRLPLCLLLLTVAAISSGAATYPFSNIRHFSLTASSTASSSRWGFRHLLSSSSSSSTSTSSSSSSRRLLAGQQQEPAQSCDAASRALLVNGAFVTETQELGDMINVLISSTMANDAYPFAKEFGFTIMDVVPGMNKEQIAEYRRRFVAKYSRLGASSVRFADYYSQDGLAAAHAIVIGTQKDVFLVFRGTADVGQVWSSANITSVGATVFGVDMDLFQAPFRSVSGIFPEVLQAVSAAVAETADPAAAKVFATGHSLGGASACFSALLLKEQGFTIGGVYNFGGYKMGKTCAPDQQCWVTVYDRHLGDVTFFWWHGQDPIPLLVDAALGTTFGNSEWGHVPSNKHWMRIAGDTCFEAPPNDACPAQVDAADGQLDGSCSQTIVEQHMPWIYLQKVARCALLQQDASSGSGGTGQLHGKQRLDSCSQEAIWTALLGFPAVPQQQMGLGGAVESAKSMLGSLMASFMRKAGPGAGRLSAAERQQQTTVLVQGRRR